MKMYNIFHGKTARIIFIVISLVNIINNVATKGVIEYLNPTHCKKYEIFNSTSFSCNLCNYTQHLEPSDNKLHCVCNKNSKIVGFENAAPVCEPCKNQTMVTLDGLHCIKCRIDNKKCSCSSNEIQIEKNAAGEYLKFVQCLPCPINMHPSIDKTQCVTKTLFSYGDLSNMRSLFRQFSQSFPNVRNFTNNDYYLNIESQLALSLCKKGSSTACEHLSNMCTLSMFTNKIVCDLFLNNTDAQVWLFYKREENNNTLKDDAISMKYNLKSQDSNSKINVSIITHKLNGEFHSVDKPDIFCAMLENVKFGINENKKCVITPKELLNRETLFYSPYLTYKEEDKLILRNIPVLVRNINKLENMSEWQLVKKFIFVDSAVGFVLMNASSVNSSKVLVRYLESLSIIITIQPNTQNKIYSPLIIVNYETLTEEQVVKNQELSLNYKVKFIVQSCNIDKNMKVSIGVLSGLAILYSMLKTWSYCKRNHDQVFHPLVIVQFLIYSFGLIANVLITVSICTCIYVFILYKGQTVFHIPLPEDKVEKNMILYTIIAFAFKCIEMVNFIYHHRNINIFFIDWEQPRTIYTRYLRNNSPSPDRKSRQKRRRPSTVPVNGARKRKRASAMRRTQFSDSRESLSIIYKPRENVDNVTEYQVNELPVSIWRTYFVANEWFELQTIRKISMLVHIICILFVLEVLGMKHYSSAIPELKLETDKNTDYSVTLHYGIGALIYITFYALQWLYITTIHAKCISNKIQHFVDLCSVANISVFILVYQYYGFYIHGRSVHGFADTDLQTLTNNLEKEESNLCAHRGLIPGTFEQTFTISLSPFFHYFYDKLLNEQSSEMLQKHEILGMLTWQRNFQSHLRVKKFLTGFVDHCFYEMDYIIKDRLLLEKLLDIEFQKPVDKTIFYTDNKHNFDMAMLYGNEWTLGTFEIILFIFVVIFSKDYIISCLTTLLISQLILIICKFNGKKNLAKKTLIDDRFIK